jgi:hypothetical protein
LKLGNEERQKEMEFVNQAVELDNFMFNEKLAQQAALVESTQGLMDLKVMEASIGQQQLLQLQNEAQSIMQLQSTLAQYNQTLMGGFYNFLNGMVQATGTAFTNFFKNIMSGTMSVGQAFKQLGKEMIASLISYTAEFIVQMTIMKLMSSLMMKWVGAQARGLAAVWSDAALLASIATLGGAVGIGAGALLTARAVNQGIMAGGAVPATLTETLPNSNIVTNGGMGFAEGGIIREPTMMLGIRSGRRSVMAEDGPEAIVPLGGGSSSSSMANSVTIVINGPVLTDDPIVWDNIAREHLIPAIDRNEGRVVS